MNSEQLPRNVPDNKPRNLDVASEENINRIVTSIIKDLTIATYAINDSGQKEVTPEVLKSNLKKWEGSISKIATEISKTINLNENSIAKWNRQFLYDDILNAAPDSLGREILERAITISKTL